MKLTHHGGAVDAVEIDDRGVWLDGGHGVERRASAGIRDSAKAEWRRNAFDNRLHVAVIVENEKDGLRSVERPVTGGR